MEKTTFMEVLDSFLKCMTMQEAEEVAVVAWKLWQRRNAYIFGEDLLHPSTLLIQSKKALDDFKDLLQKSPTPAAKTTNPNQNKIASPKDTKYSKDFRDNSETTAIAYGVGFFIIQKTVTSIKI